MVRLLLSDFSSASWSPPPVRCGMCGVAGTAGQAVIGMPVLGTGGPVAAAMAPALELKLPPDRERASVEIDILPAQPERLALALAEGQGRAPPAAVPAGRGRVTSRWASAGSAARSRPGSRRARQRGSPRPGDVSALHGDLENAGQDAVNLEHGD
jgi:hypothetical protein